MKNLRTIATALALLALPATAVAGKLADGFRGIPYGSPAPLVIQPEPDCKLVPSDPIVIWQCKVEIGGVPTVTSYSVSEDLYYATSIKTQGYSDAAALFLVLQAAWGEGAKRNDWESGILPEWMWTDGLVYSSFKYNEYSDEALVMILHVEHYQAAQAKVKARAKRSAGDL